MKFFQLEKKTFLKFYILNFSDNKNMERVLRQYFPEVLVHEIQLYAREKNTVITSCYHEDGYLRLNDLNGDEVNIQTCEYTDRHWNKVRSRTGMYRSVETTALAENDSLDPNDFHTEVFWERFDQT